MRRMETIQDLIEEAKIRFMWWAICIFVITYFLSHTSKSMWMNVPVAVFIALLLRLLANEVEFHWKVPSSGKPTSHMEKKQLPVDDSCLSSIPPPPKWKRKFESPVVEVAVEDFVDKIIQDFITDLWYSGITPDNEAPELMHAVILDALGEVAERVKEVNLVDLLTRDLIDLIGDHLELFRRTQASIGVDVMVTLSSEERDLKLKHQLMVSNDLHPALLSAESERKVLQRLVAGLLGVILKPSEAQCPLVRCIAREFVTCLIIRPIMNLVTPMYINELMEFVLLHIKDFLTGLDGNDQSSKADHNHPLAERNIESGEYTFGSQKSSLSQKTDVSLATEDDLREMASEASEDMTSFNSFDGDFMQPKVADWARKLDAATQRRTEVLAPENLENMWAIGRNYKEKINKVAKEQGFLEPDGKMTSEAQSGSHIAQGKDGNNDKTKVFHGAEKGSSSKEVDFLTPDGNLTRIRRSSSTSDLNDEPDEKRSNNGVSKGHLISEDIYGTDFEKCGGQHTYDVSNSGIHSDGLRSPKLRCRVLGAYYDKTGSKPFAVYSIAVTDAQNNMSLVKRRYRNFERLHRRLKEIPNYSLQLPPKRIFSSSTEDAFVHRRCIKLDKYLQDLLSIPNVAEQHEVLDFLSASSKTYSFGKFSPEVQALAVNVDDAVDDIVCQFQGVPDGLRQVVGSSSGHEEDVASVPATYSSSNEGDFKSYNASESSMETAVNLSDNEEGDKAEIHDHDLGDSDAKENGWHSDNEVNSKSFTPRVLNQTQDTANSYSQKTQVLETKAVGGAASLPVASNPIGDQVEVPPEWTPPNVTVPVLNLVDKVFQLNKRGWIRRQVFWMSGQILQLVMEDAVDDWLLRQINWLRKEEVVAQGIRWVKDILWPDGKFFLRLEITGGGLDEMVSKCFQATPRAARGKSSQAGSFEMQLEAARRASYVRNVLFHGAPAPLVSFVGQKQYKRCARDLYFFLQSSICLKQVAYAVLELLLVSVFPELKDVVADIHPKAQTKPA